MDIVVKGRHVEVSRKFKEHATEKLGKVERLDHRIIRLEVEVSTEPNPRQSHLRDRVEVTCVSKGPVVRAEAASTDAFSALDLAIDKLEARLRRAADKRRVHHGTRTPASLHASLAAADGVAAEGAAPDVEADAATAAAEGDDEQVAHVVVREKTVSPEPMSTDDALFQMELVGHDFFLFADAESGLPSVVYRRHGYDYGVIRLAGSAATQGVATGESL